MTFVVCAAFDAGLDQQVLAVQDLLRVEGLRVPAARHRPHLTLAGSDRPLPDVLDAVARVAVPARELVLDDAGQFHRGAALWAGSRDGGLRNWHRDVVAGLADQGLTNEFGHAAAGRWQPHCTLTRRVPRERLETAVDTVRGRLPLHGRIEFLVVVEVGGSGDLGRSELPGGPQGQE